MLTRLRKELGISVRHHRQSYQLISILSKTLFRGICDDKCEEVPTRAENLKCLQSDIFDVLVIGGGAVGCGCALDAASRGLKTALIEAEDFANGASCKSSKLIEGSSSYLSAALSGADFKQIFMLQEVLNERSTMLNIAPHLNRVQPMMMPIYSPLRLPFYWLGLKLYDAMAGMANIRGSHFLSKEAALGEFPLLRREGLLGGLVYYDGQLEDARMCLALVLTAVKHGASAANYVRLTGLNPLNCETGYRSAKVIDELTGTSFCIKSKCFISAAGAGTDAIRSLNERAAKSISVPSIGTHIALPIYYGSCRCGLVFPSTRKHDEALIMLPFENRTLVGSLNVDRGPIKGKPAGPKPEEVQCLLAQTRHILEECVHLREGHVLSAWSGVKPSIKCPCNSKKEDCKEKEVPSFLLEVSDSHLITLAGGRWSSYRVMASAAIDAAIEHYELEPMSCDSSTQNLLLDGAENFCCMLPLDLVQTHDLPMDIAQHLAESYGSNAHLVLCNPMKSGKQRLHPKFPYIEAEVIYACEREYACNPVDVIARRMRIAFVDAVAASELLAKVVGIMAKHHCWTPDEQAMHLIAADKFLIEQMGLGTVVQLKPPPKCNDDPNKVNQNKQQNSPKNSEGSNVPTETSSSEVTMSYRPRNFITEAKRQAGDAVTRNQAATEGLNGSNSCGCASIEDESIEKRRAALMKYIKKALKLKKLAPKESLSKSIPVSADTAPIYVKDDTISSVSKATENSMAPVNNSSSVSSDTITKTTFKNIKKTSSPKSYDNGCNTNLTTAILPSNKNADAAKNQLIKPSMGSPTPVPGGLFKDIVIDIENVTSTLNTKTIQPPTKAATGQVVKATETVSSVKPPQGKDKLYVQSQPSTGPMNKNQNKDAASSESTLSQKCRSQSLKSYSVEQRYDSTKVPDPAVLTQSQNGQNNKHFINKTPNHHEAATGEERSGKPSSPGQATSGSNYDHSGTHP